MTGISAVGDAHASGSEQAPTAASGGGARRSLIAGGIAAVGASLCCVAPFVLVLMGVSGAWIGSLKCFMCPFTVRSALRRVPRVADA